MNRRDALRLLGFSAAGLPGPDALAAGAEEVRGRVRTASEPSALRITDLRVASVTGAMSSHIIRLDTNQGISGYGEIRDGASPTYALMLKSRLLGENPCHVDKIFRKIKQFGGHGRQAGGVVAAEIACWDLAGKAWGVPCWQMLGGKFRDKVRIYADTPATPDPQEMGRRLKERRDRGFTFLKMDVGIDILRGVEGALAFPAGGGADPSARRTPFADVVHPFTGIRITEKGVRLLAEYVGKVREIIGGDIPLAVDHLGRFGVEDAIKLAQSLDPFTLAWIEDPIPWFYADDYVRLRNSCQTPILTGEDIYLKEEFANLFRKKAVSIAHPDLMTAGGLLETKKIGDLAQEAGIPVALHMAGSPVGLFASVHAAAAIENFLALEFHDFDQPAYDEVVDGVPKPLVGRDGFVAVPDGPGLGIELNEEAIRENLRRRGRDPEKEYFPPTPEWDNERSHDRRWS